jgi:SAM-dependent methyltransferase
MNKLYGSEYLRSIHHLFERTKHRSYEILDLNGSDDIADIGCGIGLDAVALAEFGANVVGIDSDLGLLDVARSLAPPTPKLTFLCAEAACIDMEGGSFNKLRFDRVLQHVEDHVAVLREARRLLRKKGIIQIIEPDYWSMTFFDHNMFLERKLFDYVATQRVPHAHKVRRLPAELASAGFCVSMIEIHNYVIEEWSTVRGLIRFHVVLEDLLRMGAISDFEFGEWWSRKENHPDEFNFSMNMMVMLAERGER